MLSAVVALAGVALSVAPQATPVIVAGGGIGDGAPATSASLELPTAVIRDGDGALLIADAGSRKVRRVDPRTGRTATLVDLPAPDPLPDRSPRPGDPHVPALYLTQGPGGDLYIGDPGANRVWRFSRATAELTAAAGDGQPSWPDGPPRDGARATDAPLARPRGVAVDRKGRLLIADSGHRRIRIVDPVSLRIGTLLRTSSEVFALAVAPDGSIYFTEQEGLQLFRISPGAGNAIGLKAPGQDRLRITSHQIAVDPAGAAVVGDDVGRLWKTGPDGSLAPLPTARVRAAVLGLAADGAGGFLVSTGGFREVVQVPLRGEPSPVAGAGTQSCCGDGGKAVSASLSGPEGLAYDSVGRLYIADRGNGRIRVVDESGATIETLVGGGPRGQFKDGADARSVWFGVQLIAVDPVGHVYFAANEDVSIYRYDAYRRTISRFAGAPGAADAAGDGRPALSGAMKVSGIACDRGGNLYVAGMNRIRRISASTHLVETIAGTGKLGFFGDGGSAVAADLGNPTAIAVDGLGTVFFSDSANHRIRAVDPKGTIRTVAGNGRGGPFTEGDALRAAVGEVLALAVDRAGDLVYMDWAKNLRRLLVRGNRVESLLERPVHDLNRTREAPGLAVSFAGTIAFDVPQQNRVESITPPSTGRGR